jgi:microcystin-dependent protein
MAEPFLSEIRIMSFDFAPKGWAMCNGQLLPINQNQPLFALLGTTFGGDGRVNFALPDQRARTPIHVGSGFTLGERGGEQAHTLTLSELSSHPHLEAASSAFSGGVSAPGGNFIGSANNMFHTPANLQPMNPASISNTGGSQAHNNMQPYLVLNFCIALQGIFPQRP